MFCFQPFFFHHATNAKGLKICLHANFFKANVAPILLSSFAVQFDEEQLGCGANAECTVRMGAKDCYCKVGYEGDPYAGCTGKMQSYNLRINIYLWVFFSQREAQDQLELQIFLLRDRTQKTDGKRNISHCEKNPRKCEYGFKSMGSSGSC